MALLEAAGLRREYGRLVALAGLDLTVEAGECVALVGANGSGKSTAVRAIAGLLEPSAGTVRVCGHDPHREPDAENARAALALVPDTPLLYDDLTVRQHLELVTLSHGCRRPDRRVADRLGLPPGPTSCRASSRAACARRRCSPARSCARRRCSCSTSPSSASTRRRRRCSAASSSSGYEAGAAVLLTTHQLAWADGLADRAVLLDEGEVADAGSWPEVRERAEARGWTSP